jgi:benzoate-CoA ligase family protein
MPDQPFNACEYLLDRRVAAGDGDRLAITGVAGDLSYSALLERVHRIASVLRGLGLQPEQRLVMFMTDCPDFIGVYLAAMRIGAVPVPVSTMLHSDGLAGLLRDSRARLLAVTPEFAPVAQEAIGAAPELDGVLAAGGAVIAAGAGPAVHDLDALAAAAPGGPAPVYPTTADSPAFWLYTSGTTGAPKAAMHRHGSVPAVCEAFGAQVLGIRPGDRCLSVAKAFFAYGLGNSVLFPLSAGACTILEPPAPTPEAVAGRVRQYGASLFFAGPTFFANMLRADLPADAIAGVRLAVSAGEALPAHLYERWTSHFGVDVLDGLGTTEMLNTFLSNREGAVRPGTSGVAVPGYELKILDDDGAIVPPGTPGTLFVRGESTATGYWSSYAASRLAFQGEWLRTGDTYVQDDDGYYTCLGRTNDMLKVSGIWMSPAEVEERLLEHPSVSYAAVVAAADGDGLQKPVAFVLLEPGHEATEDELIEFCREGLPSFKRPRRVVFVDSYPSTPSGKIRRVELRQTAVAVLAEPQPAAGASA